MKRLPERRSSKTRKAPPSRSAPSLGALRRAEPDGGGGVQLGGARTRWQPVGIAVAERRTRTSGLQRASGGRRYLTSGSRAAVTRAAGARLEATGRRQRDVFAGEFLRDVSLVGAERRAIEAEGAVDPREGGGGGGAVGEPSRRRRSTTRRRTSRSTGTGRRGLGGRRRPGEQFEGADAHEVEPSRDVVKCGSPHDSHSAGGGFSGGNCSTGVPREVVDAVGVQRRRSARRRWARHRGPSRARDKSSCPRGPSS